MFKPVKSTRTLLAAALTLLVAISMPHKAISNDKVHDYDWIVTLETTQLKGVLNYNGSGLKEPIKIHVTLLEGGQPDDQAVPYEDFWYVSGKPFGQEKFKKLDIPTGKQVAFRVVHKDQSVTQGHNQAAANAIARLLVDTYTKGIMLTAVKVPQDSFGQIISGLEGLNFHGVGNGSPDQPQNTAITLFVASETDSNTTQTLEY